VLISLPRRMSFTLQSLLDRSLALSLFLFLCGTLAHAQGGIALVQHTNKDAGTTTSSSLAFNANNTAGNWIGVCIRAGKSGQVFTVTDSKGNTYHKAVQFNVTIDTPNGDTLGIFYAENIGGGANTVTVSDTISATLRLAILEYSGVATASSLDTTAAIQGTSASPNSGNATTTASGDLLLSAVLTGNPASITAGNGYTIEERVPTEPNTKLMAEDQVQAVAGSISAAASLAASDNWGAGLAAFKAAGGGVKGPSITATSGSGQSATVNTAFAAQLQATVKDSLNNPMSGVVVTFTAPASGANGTFANGTATTTASTNGSGVATSTTFTANATAGGPYNVVASATGATSANFSLTNTAGAPATVTPTAGTPQSATINTAFAQLQATVKDSLNNPVSGVAVTFTVNPAVNGASGAFTGGNTATTDALGIARANTFTANGTAGTYIVMASATGATSANFSLTNVASAPASIALVQHTSIDAGTTTSRSLAFNANNAAGNWIGVAIRAGKSNQVFMVTDSRGNTYHKAVQINVSLDTPNGDTVAIYYAENIASGANTITVSDTILGSMRFAIFEYSGVATANSLDVAAAAQGTGVSVNSGNATTAANGDLLYGAIMAANAASFTAGNGYKIEETVPAEPNTKLIVEDQMQVTAGTASDNASLGTSDVWAAVLAAFQPASGVLAPPAASLSSTNIAFGNQAIGATSNAPAVMLTNTGGSTLIISSIGISGPNSGDFAETNNCGSLLARKANCTINVSFTPTALGFRNAAVTIADNAPGNPHAIALSGTGSCAILVSPRVAVLTFTQSQQFTSCDANVIWSVDGVVGGSAASGTVTNTGLYSPPSASGTHTVTVTSADQSQFKNATVYITNYSGTFTHHNDNSRTGQNLNETVLTPTNVNSAQFGKLGSYPTDGDAHASPLYVADVNISAQGFHNMVYVATEHDSIYAFDADGLTSVPLWKVSFINPAAGITTVPVNDTGFCCNNQEIGIRGTPVIDQGSGTLYLVAKTKEVIGGTTNYVQRLHALSIATGAEKFGGPMVLQGSVPGTGSGSSGGLLAFDALRQNQRPALLLSNGVVYIGFAAHGETSQYHGWVLGYDATTLQQVMAYCGSPNDVGAGIWQSGGGLAADSVGNIYFSTGNGGFDANTGGRDYGDSFVKISPSGVVLDYFTPYDQATMSATDSDLGSGGVLLLPDQPGATPRLVGSAGKTGTIYLVNRDNMGHFNANNNQIVQSLVNIFTKGGGTTDNYFSTPVYFNGFVYFGPLNDTIQAFQASNGLLSTAPISASPEIFTFPGATLAISANGSTNGILWAVQRNDVTAPGVLRAYDATNLRTELYSSNQAGSRDTLDIAAKFNTPLVANGKVFVVSVGQLTVYGLLP
jgi:centrosomal CEP192-like protein